MPNYDYICEGCDHIFEETMSIKDRDLPTKKPCPKCNKKKVRKHWGTQANGVYSDWTNTPSKKQGSAWKEVIDKMKNSGQVPKRFHERLDRSSDFRNAY